MMIQNPKKLILTRYFKIYAGILSVTFLIACMTYAFYSYKNQMSNTLQIVFEESSHIEDTLVKIFDDTNQQLVLIGKDIIKIPSPTISNIVKTVKKSCPSISFSENTETPSWHFRGWTSPDGFLQFSCVSSEILKNPINLSYRSYVQNSMNQPWKLHFSSPSAIAISGLWGIPAGMGVANEDGKTLGILSVGFNISELNLKIHNKITGYTNKSYINFVVLDNNYRVILQSPDNAIDMKSAFYNNFFRKKSSFYGNQGLLSPHVEYKNIVYISYMKIRDYPYLILMGYNKDIILSNIVGDIITKIIEIFGIYLMSLILLYLFQKNLINHYKKSENLKRKFISSVIQKHEDTINKIVISSEIIMSEFIKKCFGEGEENVNQEDEIIITEIERVNTMAKALITNFPESLTTTLIDIDSVIKECVMMHAYNTSIRGIQLVYKPSRKIVNSKFYADEFVLKQMVMALIFICIKYTPNGGKIKIKCERIQFHNRPHLFIHVEDTGLSLNIEDLERLEDRFDQYHETAYLYNINMNVRFIKKLAELHKGSISLETRGAKNGKVIKLILPFPEDNECTKEICAIVDDTEKYISQEGFKKVIH